MSKPRECDWQSARALGKYLNAHPNLVRVRAVNAQADDGCLQLEILADSDWGGCPETRRSTDGRIAYLAGPIVAGTTQTQPGLPATSSPDASRAAREAIFPEGLISKDFGLQIEIPRLWTDSSTAIIAAKRIGLGSKLRHLEVCEFYLQGAVQASKISMGKVKGTQNPANFLTKHAKGGPEVLEALPSLGMVNLAQIAGSTAVQKSSIKTMQVNPTSKWKPQIAGIHQLAAGQIVGAKAQGPDEWWPDAMLLVLTVGLLRLLWGMIWMLRWLMRQGRR